MAKQKRSFDPLTDEQRTEAVKQIRGFFEREHDMDLGLIAAEDILDFHLQLVGKPLYNKGVHDSKKVIKDRFEMMNIDLDLLTNT